MADQSEATSPSTEFNKEQYSGSLLRKTIGESSRRQRDEVVDDPHKTVELEINQNHWVELGFAPSIRIDTEPQNQIKIANEMRAAGIPCDPEGGTSIVGYLLNIEQFQKIRSMEKEYPDSFQYIIGLSMGGDSRLRVFSKNGAASFTSSAVVAAVRAYYSLEVTSHLMVVLATSLSRTMKKKMEQS